MQWYRYLDLQLIIERFQIHAQKVHQSDLLSLKSIETVTQGDVFLSDEIAKKMAMQSISGNQDPVHELSAREFEIFRLLAEGLDIDAIASTLNISSKTVSNYQTMIKQKLDINTPIELIRYAIKVGVIKN